MRGYVSFDGAHREHGVATKDKYLEILEFKRFVRLSNLRQIDKNHPQKDIVTEITVVVALELVTRDTRNPGFINKGRLSKR